jgi:glyoxylase-like metal-dependent hydrolase (beta-lactamase superfamily II)
MRYSSCVDIVIRALDATALTMHGSEIVPGIYVVKGKFADEFGFISSYVIVDGEVAAIIDPGTAGDPGKDTLEFIKEIGLNPKSDIETILCTHGHPDHIGGAGILKKQTGASIMIHEDDAEMLSTPASFIKSRLKLDLAGRMAMSIDRGPLRVNYHSVIPDGFLDHGDIINIGETSIRTIHTGGHSAGHCVFYEKQRKVLFSGDEVNNFPNDPRKFYVDLSGSLAMKRSAVESLQKLDVEFLLPSHDVSHMLGEVALQFKEVSDGVLHFQDNVLSHLTARGEADVEQLKFDIQQARSIPVPTDTYGLFTTTLEVCLRDLSRAGLVRSDEKGIWRPV